jgi:hypothetical protein
MKSSIFPVVQFLIMAWARHLDPIPNEVGGIILEPVHPFVEREPPLFIRTSELIHSKCDTLQFCVFVRVLKVHDYIILEDSSDDSSDSSADSSIDGIPRAQASLGSSLCPWPKIYWVADNRVSPSGDACPSLHSHGGGVAWSLSLLVRASVSCSTSHTPQKPGESCFVRKGQANEESTRPWRPVQFKRDTTAPHEHADMVH